MASQRFMDLSRRVGELRHHSQRQLRNSTQKSSDPDGHAPLQPDAMETLIHTLRARQRDLFDHAPDAYILTDGSGRILQANRMAVAMLGVPPSLMRGKLLSGYVAKNDRELFASTIANIGEHERAEIIVGLRPRGSRREPIAVHASVVVFRSGSEVPAGYKWIFRDVTEAEAARTELSSRSRKLRLLATRNSLAEADNRRNVCNEIHDKILQPLALANMLLSTLIAEPAPGHADTLKKIDSMLRDAMERMRQLNGQLGPSMLFELGLNPAVDWLTDRMRRSHGVRLVVENNLTDQPLPLNDRVLIFLMIRQLLDNVAAHSKANRASLTLAPTASDSGQAGVRVEVQDDGAGFDPAAQGGLGLFDIQSQLEEMGGWLTISSRAGSGTRIEFWAPLSSSPMDPTQLERSRL